MPATNNGRVNMGMGNLGFANQRFKMKHRFTFEVVELCGNNSIPASYVKVASRPTFQADEIELHHLNAIDYLPGKAKWDTMTITYYDTANADMQPLYNWIASVYNFSNPVTLEQGSTRADYCGTGIIYLYDGCGTPLEQWTLMNAWPQQVQFGDLDMSASEIMTVDVTLRFSQVHYQSLCPAYIPKSCCSPCNGSPLYTDNPGTRFNTLGQLV